MKLSKVALLAALAYVFCFAASANIFCQTETFGSVQYSRPEGWSKSEKSGVTIFSDTDQKTGGFCILSIYAAVQSSDSPQKDFAQQWQSLIAQPFKTTTIPKTDVQTDDGWTSVSGASDIETDGNPSSVIMTVISGYGKTTSIYAILNDRSYLEQLANFMASIKLDKGVADSPAKSAPGTPQNGFSGTLKESVTMADLTGAWSFGAGSVQSYIDSSSGDYAGTSTAFYGEQYFIRADGMFTYKFTGRSGNVTVRESDSGRLELAGGFLNFKFKGRSPRRFQLIGFMTQPNGAVILSLHGVKQDGPGFADTDIAQLCSHSKGYMMCVGSEEWARLPAK